MANTKKTPVTQPENLSTPAASLLSKEDREAIQARVREELAAEKVEAAKEAYAEAERRRMRIEEGMVTGGPLDERIDLAISVTDHEAYSPLRINGAEYHHGHTYNVPRHVANQLMEMMQNIDQHVRREIRGEKMGEFYRSRHSPVLRQVAH